MIPAGAVPLGAFTEFPVTPGAAPLPVLADFIDPLTGDFLDLLASRTPVDGAIIEGLRVERNSGPAVALVGTTLREIRNTDATSLSEVRGRTRDGLAELEREGLAKLVSATVELNSQGDSVNVAAKIRDFTVDQGQPSDRMYAVARGGV